MNNTTNDRERVSDPQIVVTGTIKQSNRSEVIVFTIPLALIELVCVATIPEEGTKFAPVYVKFRIKP